MIAVPLCRTCTHFKRNNKEDVAACKAFPDGIPVDIIIGRKSHKQPVEGDHGLQFELAPDMQIFSPK